MAQELTIAASVTYDDGINPQVVLAVLKRLQTVTTTRPNLMVQSIPTTAAGTGILLGAADTLGGLMLVVNLDPTNFVTLYRTTGPVHAFAVLSPDTNADGNGGLWFTTKLGSALLAPYAVADTAACRVAIFTCPP